MPFITVYTVPTGNGDFFPGFYRSSMTYIINASPVANKYYTAFANIKNATTPPYYASTLISMIQSPVVNPKGSYLSNEKILAFTISSNSSSPTNSVEFVIQKLGVITANTTQELVFLNNSVNLATNLSLGSAMAADDKLRYEQETSGVAHQSDEEKPEHKKGKGTGKGKGKSEDKTQSDEEKPEPKKGKGASEDKPQSSKKVNGYTHFCSANRTSVKEDNPEMSATEITKELARQWKELDEDEQNEWKQAV